MGPTTGRAAEAQLPLVYAPLESLVSKWVGQGEQQVTRVTVVTVVTEQASFNGAKPTSGRRGSLPPLGRLTGRIPTSDDEYEQ